MATKSEITTLESAPVVEQAKEVTAAGQNYTWASGKRELLTLYSSPETGGDGDVECGINGVAFRIKRDVPVNVPTELVGVFRNAVMTHYVDGKAIDRPRYAFSATPV